MGPDPIDTLPTTQSTHNPMSEIILMYSRNHSVYSLKFSDLPSAARCAKNAIEQTDMHPLSILDNGVTVWENTRANGYDKLLLLAR